VEGDRGNIGDLCAEGSVDSAEKRGDRSEWAIEI